MDSFTIEITTFQGVVLLDALNREWKLLEIVTAQEREANNRDGWALARIKIRALRGVMCLVSRELTWIPREGRGLHPDEDAELAARIAAVGQKMRPPRAELEKLMSLKARRRAAARRAKPSGAEAAKEGTAPPAHTNEKSQKLPWTAPKYG